MSIKSNISDIRQSLPDGVSLVCVSKYHTEKEILEAYSAGERCFAESRATELELKALSLPKDIQWHFIGHLQRNKVKQVCRYASMIQSVDSERLLTEIDKTVTHPIDVLLEVHIAQEDTKTGLSFDDLFNLLQSLQTKPLQRVQIVGLMGMATQTDNNEQISNEFKQLRKLFDKIKQQYFFTDERFSVLSMGMSGDYKLAIEEGATMVRIGSLIFSEDE